MKADGRNQSDIHAFQRATGIYGTSAHGRNLPYCDAAGIEYHYYPADLMHMAAHKMENLVCCPTDGQTLYSSQYGYVQLRYPDSLSSIAKCLDTVKLPTRHSGKILGILAQPLTPCYASSYELIMFGKSGLLLFSLFGNIPSADFAHFADIMHLFRLSTCGASTDDHVQNLTTSGLQSRVAAYHLLPDQMQTRQWHGDLHVAQRTGENGPLVNIWCMNPEHEYGYAIRNNSGFLHPEKSMGVSFVVRHLMIEEFSAHFAEKGTNKGSAEEAWAFWSPSQVPSRLTSESEEGGLLAAAAAAIDVEVHLPVDVTLYARAKWDRIEFDSSPPNCGIAFLEYNADSGDYFIRYGRVRQIFDVPYMTSTTNGYMFVDVYLSAPGNTCPWWYGNRLDRPCIPLSPAGDCPLTQLACVSISNVVGQVYFTGIKPSSDGDVLVIHAFDLDPTHHANRLKKAFFGRIPDALLEVIFGMRPHCSVETLHAVTWNGVWPAPLPPLQHAPEVTIATARANLMQDAAAGSPGSPAALAGGAVYPTVASGDFSRGGFVGQHSEDDDDAADEPVADVPVDEAMPEEHERAYEDGELLLSKTAHRRLQQRLQTLDPGYKKTVGGKIATGRSIAKRARVGLAAAAEVAVPLGQSKCSRCGGRISRGNCKYKCCSKKCCSDTRAAISPPGGAEACGLLGHQ